MYIKKIFIWPSLTFLLVQNLPKMKTRNGRICGEGFRDKHAKHYVINYNVIVSDLEKFKLISIKYT